ncbi:RNase P protein component [Bradyrhizobium sp. CIR18]|nr:RNase P protein component [Bradyrhizobium sp. CIR18]
MAKAFRSTVMALTFVVVAGSNIIWSLLDDYVACGLALAASATAGFCVERAFIKRSHREMIRQHGTDWQVGSER